MQDGQCHPCTGTATVTPAGASSIPPCTRAEPPFSTAPPSYLGEQRGTLQRGLHQLVQGEEELLQ